MSEAIYITHMGRKKKLADLAKSVGLAPATLTYRWNRAGKPEVISNNMLSPPDHTRVRKGMGGRGKKKPEQAIRIITAQEYQGQQKTRKETLQEDRSPGWAERKYFPNTGNNGFSGAKRDNFAGWNSTSGMPVYTGCSR